MTHTTFSAIGDLFRSHQRFLILSHVRPDGDAYGATLGLGLCLEALHKDVLYYNQDGLEPFFSFLPGSEKIQTTPVLPPEPDRCLIAVDAATPERLGRHYLDWNLPITVNIDHHVSNPQYGSLPCVMEKAAATCEILYDLLHDQRLPCPPETARNLFVGLSTDTSSFKNPQTTPHSFEVAAALSRAGANPAQLATQCFLSYSTSRLLLLKEALNQLTFAHNGQIAYFILTKESFQRTGATHQDSEGLLESLQCIAPIEVAFMLETLEEGTLRVSLRSRGHVNVEKIASALGGGGHTLAAGIRSKKKSSELLKLLQKEIEKQLGTSIPATNT